MARYPKDNGTIMQTNTRAKDIESPITFPGLGIVRGVHWFRTKTLLSVAVAGPGVAVSGRSQPRPGSSGSQEPQSVSWDPPVTILTIVKLVGIDIVVQKVRLRKIFNQSLKLNTATTTMS